MKLRALLATTALAVSGCTVGPDLERPVTVADSADAFVHATPETASLEPSAVDSWWLGFADAATARLVDEALLNNTDLRAAAARVLAAEASLTGARANRFPEVTGSVGPSRARSSFTLPEIGLVAVEATTYSAELRASYQVDLFGKLRRTRQAAWADLLAQRSARDALTHAVIAQVVRSRILVASLDRARQTSIDIRDSWQRTLETSERRYRSGITDALDVRLARENLASAEAQVILAEQQLAQSRLALDELVGRRPGTGATFEEALEPLPPLDAVPMGLPVDLLDRRPDLRQAEAQMIAATARVGVAMADLFPSLSLTGSAGQRSDDLSNLTSSDALVWSLAANLLGPIFDAGARRANVTVAEARAEEATALYVGSVLAALGDVEDALVRDQSGRQRLELLDQRLVEARAADRIARQRYQRGVLPLLQVLETERRLRLAETALIDAQAELWRTRVDLYLALGGDWLDDDSAPQTTDAIASTADTVDAASTDLTGPTEDS